MFTGPFCAAVPCPHPPWWNAFVSRFSSNFQAANIPFVDLSFISCRCSYFQLQWQFTMLMLAGICAESALPGAVPVNSPAPAPKPGVARRWLEKNRMRLAARSQQIREPSLQQYVSSRGSVLKNSCFLFCAENAFASFPPSLCVVRGFVCSLSLLLLSCALVDFSSNPSRHSGLAVQSSESLPPPLEQERDLEVSAPRPRRSFSGGSILPRTFLVSTLCHP